MHRVFGHMTRTPREQEIEGGVYVLGCRNELWAEPASMLGYGLERGRRRRTTAILTAVKMLREVVASQSGLEIAKEEPYRRTS